MKLNLTTRKIVASDCMDERFIPYNGSCFLFVFYPEVDWLTAQNACRGIGTQLASIATKEEENFVVNAIRNSLDFSPQALYWVGGELAHNGKFEWVDGTEMKLKGIMSAQIPAVERDSEQICLGLQTKASMGAGLHWVSKPCTSIGGYICKRKASLNFETIVQNQTISDSYGRLTSPGYPNQYPVNINYWITISGPDNSRIILQFQKIDIETQEECLYDYIGLNNIDSVLHSYIATSSTFYSQDTNSSSAHDFNGEDTVTSSAEDIDTLANEFKRTSWKQHTTHLDNRRKRYWTPKNHHESESSSQRGDTSNPTIKNSGSYVNNNNNSDRKRTRTTTGNYTVTEFYKVDSLKIRNSSNKLMHGSTSEYDTTFDTSQNYLRLCGAHEASLSKYNFISRTNELYLHFHSDFSITGSGYALTWNAVDTSGCPIQTLTAHEGFINTPNYPHFLLNNLDCTYVIQAPHGKRVLVEFTDFDIVSGAEVKLNIGDELFRPFSQKLQLNDGVYVTRGEKMVIRLQTGEQPRGKGFRAIYKTMNSVVAQKIVDLSNNSYGRLFHLNYPQSFPIDVDYTQHIIAPVGQVILLELHGVSFSKEGCHFGSSIEVFDNYADNNGTWWELCDTSDIGLPLLKDQKTRELQADDDKKVHNHNSPIHIRSYLNSLHIRQKVKGLTGARLNATVFLQEDDKYKVKLLEAEDDSVESCVPNPCLYGGRCITNGEKRKCQCKGHFVGKFCALNVCELDPCIYGQCELTPNKFKCHCQPGYSGVHCDLKQDPCEDNPCENRGECSDNKGTFHCRCHAWWEGRRCEKRMRVPFKPLSERMLQEPFWLGLITVFVVLGVIGLFWCAKRHFPEKIEKLIAEESERNRPTHGYHNHPSLREQLHLTSLTMNAANQPASVANTPGQHRSIFGRLGIRKPSILSLSSPHTPGGATSRTFSLDDLLRPPPRRKRDQVLSTLPLFLIFISVPNLLSFLSIYLTQVHTI
uniref:CSON009597 protein n=1 Tax=Culicoides sonorensis TaxID=179676 RepID=A0A336N357_CULSO